MKLKACFLLLFSFNVFAQETPCQDIDNNYYQILISIGRQHIETETRKQLCSLVIAINDGHLKKATEITKKFSDRKDFEGTPKAFVTSFHQCLQKEYPGANTFKEYNERNDYLKRIASCKESPETPPSKKIQFTPEEPPEVFEPDKAEEKTCKHLNDQLKKLTPYKTPETCFIIRRVFILEQDPPMSFNTTIHEELKDYFQKHDEDNDRGNSIIKALHWDRYVRDCKGAHASPLKRKTYKKIEKYNNFCLNQE